MHQPVTSHPNRRHLLQATAAGVAVLASGCASIGGQARPQVVVVGGGWGGLGAVRALVAAGTVDVTLIEPNGSQQTTTLADWRQRHAGQPVALYLWAEWCPICKLQQPNVSDLAAELPLLTIAMQSGPPPTVARVLAQRQLTWATAVDPRGELSRALGFGSVPAFVVIDAEGRLRTPTVGYTSELGMRLRLWWAGVF